MNDICSKRRLYGNGIAADLIHLISSHSVQIMPNVTFTAFMKMCLFFLFKTHTLEIIVVFYRRNVPTYPRKRCTKNKNSDRSNSVMWLFFIFTTAALKAIYCLVLFFF